MHLSFDVPSPLDYFQSLVETDDELPLLETAICVAQDEYPQLDVQAALSTVDHLVERLHRRVGRDDATLARLRALNRFFYKDLGFRGNVNDYYDPSNSFIHEVLERRVGIPISLALIWLELARSLGLPAHGVCFPGHFLIKVKLPLGLAVVDPLTGESLGRDHLEEILLPYRRRTGLTDVQDTPLSLYLQAAPERDILARMLRNLKEIYQQQSDWARMLAAQERLVVLMPQAWSEYRDRGLAHAALGHHDRAVADLECYLVHTEDLADMDRIAEKVQLLRREIG
jgi:regulator of sirC expression with transglutaminase-like and TPR domain